VERAIPLQSRAELERILGLFDSNVRRIREMTGAEVYVRGNEIRVRGNRRSVERALRALEEIRRGGNGAPADVPPEERPGGAFPLPGRIFRPGRAVEPKSAGQAAYLAEMDRCDLVFAIGPAGTGKTFLAVAKSLEHLRAQRVRRIVLVRPAVEAGEKLGFLPGDIAAKVNPYLRPIYDSLNIFLEYGQLQRLIQSDIIEICPLAFMRGRTLDEAFVILDEAQNTTNEQMLMALTRLGARAKMVVTGDVTQIDLPKGTPSGLVEAQRILRGVPGVSFVHMTREDIVRHPLVQKIVEAYGRAGGRGE
jgi:phosphate starvation-inducible PhoH-like protein